MPIVRNLGNCSGCLLCSLICSFYNTPERAFNLSKSMIKVKPGGNNGRAEVEISENCIGCNICVAYCYFGVLDEG